MINKIIASTIFISCLFALSLSLLGVTGRIEIADDFRRFLINCDFELQNYKVAIPVIPKIPSFLPQEREWYETVLSVLINVINALAIFINVIITFINTLISIIEFIVIVLKNLIIFRDSVFDSFNA